MLITRTVISASRCGQVNPAISIRPSTHLRHQVCKRHMAAVVQDVPHLERTANDARQRDLHHAKISHVEQVNKTIRTIRLSLSKAGVGIAFTPLQVLVLLRVIPCWTNALQISCSAELLSLPHRPYLNIVMTTI